MRILNINEHFHSYRATDGHYRPLIYPGYVCYLYENDRTDEHCERDTNRKFNCDQHAYCYGPADATAAKYKYGPANNRLYELRATDAVSRATIAEPTDADCDRLARDYANADSRTGIGSRYNTAYHAFRAGWHKRAEAQHNAASTSSADTATSNNG